jgi:hypothetical protein
MRMAVRRRSGEYLFRWTACSRYECREVNIRGAGFDERVKRLMASRCQAWFFVYGGFAMSRGFVVSDRVLCLRRRSEVVNGAPGLI